MRYTQLRAFDAVAREGAFTRAAEALRLTQPAVTIQVARLEREYGVRLLRRHAGRTELTDAGRELFRLTRRLFGVEAQVREFLGATQALEAGRLTLGADSPPVAMPLVAGVMAAHPGLDVEVRLGNAPEIWHGLLEQRVDAVVVADPQPDARMVSMRLGVQSLVALVPADHTLARRRSLAVRDLDQLPLVLREPASNTRRLADSALAAARIAPRVVLTLDSREAVREAIAVGLGIGFALEREAGADPRVRAIPLSDSSAGSTDCLVAFADQVERRVVQALFDIAADLHPAGRRR